MNNPYNYSNPNPNRPRRPYEPLPQQSQQPQRPQQPQPQQRPQQPRPWPPQYPQQSWPPQPPQQVWRPPQTRRRNANNPRSRFRSGRNNHNPRNGRSHYPAHSRLRNRFRSARRSNQPNRFVGATHSSRNPRYPKPNSCNDPRGRGNPQVSNNSSNR